MRNSRSSISIFPIVLMLIVLSAVRTVVAIPGDVDIDSQITEADRSMLSDFLLQKISLGGTALSNADANLDGQVDIADLLQVSITLSTIFHIRSSGNFSPLIRSNR